MNRIKNYKNFIENNTNESVLNWVKSKINSFLQKVKLKGKDYTNLMSSVLPKEIKDIIKQEVNKYFNKKESKLFEENFFNLQLQSDQDIEKMSEEEYKNFLQEISIKMDENPYFKNSVSSNENFIKHLNDKGIIINNNLMVIARPSMDNIRTSIEKLNYGPILTKFLKSAAYFVFFSMLLLKLTSCGMDIADIDSDKQHTNDQHSDNHQQIASEQVGQYFDQLVLDNEPDTNFKSITNQIKDIVNSSFQNSKLSDNVKKEISDHIKNVNIIKIDKDDIDHKYGPKGNTWGGFYQYSGDKDYIIVANNQTNLESISHTLIHELMHLADLRTDGKYELKKNISDFMNLEEIKKLVENPNDYIPKSSNFDDLKPEIQEKVLDSLNIATKPVELNNRFSAIMGSESEKANNYWLAIDKDWFSSPAEVYAEMRTMKLFLVTVGKLDNVNSDVTPELIKNILNGGLKQNFDNGRLKDQNWIHMLLFLKTDDKSIENFCKYLNI